MTGWPDRDALATIRARARQTAAALRLPFRAGLWQGQLGNWAGAGVGSSIDFQDHRPYMPGDDPRYIDWQAYARSGEYSMKLYREEVSPRVDLVLDGTGSMIHRESKRAAAFGLFYFALESGLQNGCSVRCHLVDHDGARRVRTEAAADGAIDPPASPRADSPTPALDRVPLRSGSLRVVVTDLLFPGSAEPLLRRWRGSRGRAVVFAPYDADEARPDWADAMELIDAETDERRVQHIDDAVRRRYRDAYRRHFAFWTDQARRYEVPLARIDAGNDLQRGLFDHALPRGAVEPWT